MSFTLVYIRSTQLAAARDGTPSQAAVVASGIDRQPLAGSDRVIAVSAHPDGEAAYKQYL